MCAPSVTQRLVSSECYYCVHLTIWRALFVEIGFGVRRKHGKVLKRVTVTCTLAIPAVILCVPAVSILFGDFAHGVEILTIGLLCLPNDCRRLMILKRVHHITSGPSGYIKLWFTQSFICTRDREWGVVCLVCATIVLVLRCVSVDLIIWGTGFVENGIGVRGKKLTATGNPAIPAVRDCSCF
jgi:hypothetical protein